MKPIFRKEKEFLEKKLKMNLPNYCWRDGSKLFLNHFDKKPFLTFKVDLLNNSINVKKYEEPILTFNKTYEEEYELIKNVLDKKIRDSINQTKEVFINNPNIKKFVSISGGKDSDVMKHIVDLSIAELKQEKYDSELSYNLVSFNTSNDTAETYLHLKQNYNMNKENIISPEVGYYQWITKDKKYFTPSRFVRNCCSTYKEGQLNKIMDKEETTITFLGMRAPESVKRAYYKFDLNESHIEKYGKLNAPNNWKRYLPIVEWTDAEVWLYILSRQLKYNDMYNMGFNRVGCLICPYQQDYIDMLIRYYYPNQYRRWNNILDKNFEIYNIENRLKWSKEEWSKGGRWKNATSKESEIISKKMTPERVKELSHLKGISEEMAKKYFTKKCSCGKKMNPTEISMFLKLMGRYEGIEDNRQYLCKKCLSKFLGITTNEYKEKNIEFIENGCDLF